MSIRMLLCVAIFLLSMSGCGDGKVTVRGVVTVDGKPLEKGLIAFVPPPSFPGPSVGGDIDNGNYRLAEPIQLGSYSVEIRSWQKTGKQIAGLYGEKNDEVLQVIPDKYNKNTVLRFNPSDDPSHADFNLTSK